MSFTRVHAQNMFVFELDVADGTLDAFYASMQNSMVVQVTLLGERDVTQRAWIRSKAFMNPSDVIV